MRRIRIRINGPIIPNDYQEVYDWFDMEATSPKKIRDQIQDEEDLIVEINSPGGDVFSGSEIYSLLKSAKNKVTVEITGIAASAASVIAMAGDVITIAPTAQLMIHNVSSTARGDYRDLKHQADVIENYNKSIAAAYRLKTNLAEETLLELMNKETWLNAKEAVEMNFCDSIMFDDFNMLVASDIELLPEHKILEARKAIENKKQMKLTLECLKLGGKSDLSRIH